jgi:hypothetical protein
MTQLYQAGLPWWQSRARTILALAFIGLPSVTMAEDAVRPRIILEFGPQL